MKTQTQNEANQMVKCFELTNKNTKEIYAICVTETAIRKQYLELKDDGEDVSEWFVQENFITMKEWNDAMRAASGIN